MNEGKTVGETSDGSSIKRRKSSKGIIRREEILTAAMRHFASAGYQSASFAAIAADVGLSLPGLLHYFPTKVDLLLAILDKRDLESTSAIDASSANWRTFLLGLIEVARNNQTIPGVVQAFSVLNAESLTTDHPAQAWFASRVHDLKGNLVLSLQKGLTAGELKADTDPDIIAAELIAMMDGLQMLWLRSPEEFDMVTIFSAYTHRLIAAIERVEPRHHTEKAGR
ncbi:TetR/AcrR family transcriptional regulator [Rhizobiaceae bacterium CRRU44]|uniref:TetR/AcrR family transcriptional regulator n=1 Tax=Ferranicluibacter rubi TaxID=2715133 RepID=A0AA44CCS4_9HYPH|nr:TetR/AcrR family transcriptional regulator [Ferranicluibacter rubi]NHT78545.1 TetR/AcrR family transcriptional regulator [Ferranicluibacter rubi]